MVAGLLAGAPTCPAGKSSRGKRRSVFLSPRQHCRGCRRFHGGQSPAPARTSSAVRIPRSRQISARTSPIGRSRSWAAICFKVGRLARTASVAPAGFFAGRGVGRVRGLRAADAERAGRGGHGCSRSSGSVALSAAAIRRPRVMCARISARSLVPKRTAIQQTVIEEGRRLRSSASRLPWVISLLRTRRRRVVRAGEAAAACSWCGSGFGIGSAVSGWAAMFYLTYRAP